MLTVVQNGLEANEAAATAGGSLLDEIVRDDARRMLAVALEAEVAAYIDAHADQVDADGRRLAVRNGRHEPRQVTTAAGALGVQAPRVNDKRVFEVTGERRRFASAILPAWARKSPRIAEVLPLLYLHGFRESSESWADLLRDVKRRGMAAPVLAVGDGAFGLLEGGARGVPRDAGAALLPQDRERVERVAEVGAARRESGAGRDLRGRGQDPRRGCPGAGVRRRVRRQVPKAAARITDDLDVLLRFYDYQGEHWVHLGTTNPIESTFATVRLRTRVTKGPGSRAAGVEMAFKLIEAAQQRWRMVNAPHLVALVRAGATFTNGQLVERPDQDQKESQQAAKTGGPSEFED